MTEFMEWLYMRYIHPEIKQEDDSGYRKYFALLSDELTLDQQDAHDRALEFYACSAFLLGLRTGAGLYSAQQRDDFLQSFSF